MDKQKRMRKMIHIYIDLDAITMGTWYCPKHGRVNQSAYNEYCFVCGSFMLRTFGHELFAEEEDVIQRKEQKTRSKGVDDS
jgi:hypothetical protein